ncbi:MAG: glycine cleavage system aminomethyltransferase GcvT, partial [bacterium]
LDFLQALTTNDVGRLHDGRMQYSLLPNAAGGLYDDIIVTRLAENRYYVVVNASNTTRDLAWLQERAPAFGVRVGLLPDRTLLALQGPRAQELLQPLVSSSLDTLAYYHLRADRVLGFEALISRSGYTGEDGFELSLPEAAAAPVWERLLALGLARPVGLGARNTLRLEVAYPLYGHELDADHSPYEAGLGWVIKPDKGAFTGRDAMLRAKDAPTRRLVGFRALDKGVARDGYAVLDPTGAPVGKVSSGAPSPSLDNVCVGLAYVPPALATLGTRVSVDVRGRTLAVEIVRTPFVPSKVRKNV